MFRILLFLLTNLAVLLVFALVMQALGVERWLAENGVPFQFGGMFLFCAVFGMLGAFLSLALSKWLAKRSVGARVIVNAASETERWLLATVGRHARAAGIGMPEVAVFESATPNAFATGARRNHSLVAVSSGLLRRMTREEVDGVLAHEVSHIANGDMVTMALLQGVLNTFVLFLSRVVGIVVDRVVLKNTRGFGIGYFVTTIVAHILFGILASFVVMWFSRRREFRADAGGARLAGSRAMISALERLKSGPAEPLPEGLAVYGVNGGTPRGWRRLLLSHPPLDERIAALKRARDQGL